MMQRRLRVVKWLNTTPAIGVCTLCSLEFKVPLIAIRRTADAQTDMQEQFDRHKCDREDASPTASPGTANASLRQEPDDDEDEEEENDNGDRNEDGEDDDEDDMTDDGYSP
jgi:hypothetical protein